MKVCDEGADNGKVRAKVVENGRNVAMEKGGGWWKEVKIKDKGRV